MTVPVPNPDAFITRWRNSGAAEKANYQLFLIELCELLGLERPRPATEERAERTYVFEKPVPLAHGTTGFIDLYKRGCFVLEAKQLSDGPGTEAAKEGGSQPGKKGKGASGWDTAMERARQQAQTYARSLPAEELTDGGRPPFLIVVDVGHTIELYSEFTRTGGNYTPFPDPRSYRLTLDDLRDEEKRALLRAVWTEPMGLDPSRRSARVTREIAKSLAALAVSLEKQHEPDVVAHFLMRCLFTMFAEDVRLLPEGAFTGLLGELRQDPEGFTPMVETLWKAMDSGGYSVVLRQKIPQFNGGLFAEQTALALDGAQIGLLIEAARSDWRDVEPAIFGTLLERALSPAERHKLGAHYTPRAYVERLVGPTVVEPLRAEWEAVQAAALRSVESGETKKAIAEVDAFRLRLATVRVLDPACGTGNFLYVTMEQLKRLEGEVLNVLRDLGVGQLPLEIEGEVVTPKQFLGIEVNPRAAAIAELVLWIGYLQWHLRTRGDVNPPEPIIRDFHNIECRDAVMTWDAVEPLTDGEGRPVTRWDGRTTKAHPVTGEEVPDETARVAVARYINPRPAEWPGAEFVVGNPPFIGTARMREALGDGYTEAIRSTYQDVPASADYVMFWWNKAAGLTREGRVRRFGLITTNSLGQTFNRRVVQRHLGATPPLSLLFAIPDHPWVDSEEGAAVRIAMTAAALGETPGILRTVIEERETGTDEAAVVLADKAGRIQADLTIGADVASAVQLYANGGISNRGFELGGAGFIVTVDQARNLGFDTTPGIERHIREYRNGRDLTATPRGVMVIDLYGLSEAEVRLRFPEIYQWVYERVKPERDQNPSKTLRENWWLHRRLREDLRDMLVGLPRYIATVETSKHRFFVFLDASILPDNKLVNIAFDDAYHLGVLSSRVHVVWALATGSHLGVGDDPVYVKTACFERFPFPDANEQQKAHIRELGEQLDAHRKRQQGLYPELTLTGMYNVLEKLRAGEALSEKERAIYEQGLVSVLREIHDELDAAVAEAYGWPADLSDEAILERLVALNAERAAEEARGVVRWLRPEYQIPRAGLTVQQPTLVEYEEEVAAVVAAEAQAWPSKMAEQAQAVRAALVGLGRPATAKEVAGTFKDKAPVKTVGELLATLSALGQARDAGGGRYVGG
jgi:hypothetical protein